MLVCVRVYIVVKKCEKYKIVIRKKRKKRKKRFIKKR